MKPFRAPANPFTVWTDLAFKTTEMMMASAHVINHRTTQMMNSDPIPSAADQAEFNLMSQEKVEAAHESMFAMTRYMMGLNQQIGTETFKHMMAGTSDFMSLAFSQTPEQMMTRQAKLMQTLTDSAVSASHLSHTTATLVNRGLKPIHRRATANAKRLGTKGK
ncbi:polyhydroxyalkanoate granule-associated phasin [Asticcacaulis endophyticus]|uniref:Phasin protein n=1 Tax=Asticcacaulis endophyticus TaxID=1395890 RepID=A0A918PZ77_9CAUL|nr:polyhydroxyalkanoate granule-associated phasin [Asticcacaulis endophyticus]GGZ26319.1 hypothetical protein GCM10011273_09810 [Asticcacaulis endophyticus]